MVRFNFIGCGKLGQTLAYLIANQTNYQIGDVLTRHLGSAQAAADFIGQGRAINDLSQLKSADVYCLAVPDDMIKTTCEQLLTKHRLAENAIIIHFSGALSSDELSAAKVNNYAVASLHFAHSFNPKTSIQQFRGVYCMAEGDLQALSQLEPIIKQIGAELHTINKSSKVLYHAACVMANNYLTTLYAASEQLMSQTEVDSETAKQLLSDLMVKSLEKLKYSNNTKNALTGPIARGDCQTVAKHLMAIKDPALNKLYQDLGRGTCELFSLDNCLNFSFDEGEN